MRREAWITAVFSFFVIVFMSPPELPAAPFTRKNPAHCLRLPAGGRLRPHGADAGQTFAPIPARKAHNYCRECSGGRQPHRREQPLQPGTAERPDDWDVQPGASLCPAIEGQWVRYDLLKFAWIGSTAREASLFTVRSDSPYRSVSDLRNAGEPIPLATSGPQTMTYQFPALLKEYAGLNFKMISYPSGTESLLALERKEADGTASIYSSLKPYIKRGLIRPLIRGRLSAAGIENLPIDEDLATDKRGKTLMALRSRRVPLPGLMLPRQNSTRNNEDVKERLCPGDERSGIPGGSG